MIRINAHTINDITSKIFVYFKYLATILNSLIHTMTEQERDKGSGSATTNVNSDNDRELSGLIESLRQRDPLLARLVRERPEFIINYFLAWSEDEFAVFLWKLWEVSSDENRKLIENAIETMIKEVDVAKIRNAAKIAKKLIENEKRELNIA
mgnify:CR=1 FL=1